VLGAASQEVQLAMVAEFVRGPEQAVVRATAKDARAEVPDAAGARDVMAAAWVATGAGTVGIQATAQAGNWRVAGVASQEVQLAMVAEVVRGAEQAVVWDAAEDAKAEVLSSQEVQLAMVAEVVRGAEQAVVRATAEDARAEVLDAAGARHVMAAAWVATGAGMVGGI